LQTRQETLDRTPCTADRRSSGAADHQADERIRNVDMSASAREADSEFSWPSAHQRTPKASTRLGGIMRKVTYATIIFLAVFPVGQQPATHSRHAALPG